MAFDPLRHGVLAGLAPNGVFGGDETEISATGPEVPELLVMGTVWAAMRIARDGISPSRILSRRAAWLVGEALQALASNRWQLVLALVPAMGLTGG